MVAALSLSTLTERLPASEVQEQVALLRDAGTSASCSATRRRASRPQWAALSLVDDGTVLYLDAGTTCQEVVPLLAARTVGTLNIDLAFLGTGAWDLLHGVTSHSSDKVLLKQAVMRSAASVALFADSTKWGDVERFAVARLDEFDAVVTDAGLPSEVVDSIEARGLKALRAE